MQEEREDTPETTDEEVEAHRRIAKSEEDEEEVEGHRFVAEPGARIAEPGARIGRSDQEGDDEEVEAHRWVHGDKPEEFGQRIN